MVFIGQITSPDDGLVYSGNVQMKIGQKIIGSGTLFVAQSSLSWKPSNDSDGISICWKQISAHGISSSPTKCIYFMLDHQLNWSGVYDSSNAEGNQTNGTDHSDDDDEDEVYEDAEEEQITEFWLIPEDLNTVDIICQAMSECQACVPDSADSMSDDSDCMVDDGIDIGSENGDEDDDEGETNAAHNMNSLSLNDDRFEDADE